MNPVDTLFVLICAAMVLLMTPALAVFYAGLCRRKSGVDIMMQVWICLAVVGLLWALIGFSLAFGPDAVGGLLGGADFFLLRGVGLEASPAYSAGIPFIVYFFLQTAYAVITPALICGATAERMTLKAWVLFSLLWSLVVYLPLAHMTWGGGLYARLGLVDWGGGVVIHASAGFSALAAAMVLKKRKVLDNMPCDMAQVSINCGILLFGWLAFNAAGALAVNGQAVWSMVNSFLGAMMGMAVWVILTALREKRPSFLSAMIGFLSGLVAVTPAAGVTNAGGALALSLLVSVLCYLCINIVRPKLGFDDTFDVWGLHGMGGLAGTILLPLFADPALVEFSGGIGTQLCTQAICAIIAAGFSFAATWGILRLIGLVVSLRLPAPVEGSVDEMVYHESMNAP